VLDMAEEWDRLAGVRFWPCIGRIAASCGNHNDPILADVLPHAEKDVLQPRAGTSNGWVADLPRARPF
jgi:hypothetical protein